jgi:hypothetical protein
MYYLCERAFTSRWKSSKVGLFLPVLGITLLCISSTVIPQLLHSARINSSDRPFASDHWFLSYRIHRSCHDLIWERNYWKDNKLKMQHHIREARGHLSLGVTHWQQGGSTTPISLAGGPPKAQVLCPDTNQESLLSPATRRVCSLSWQSSLPKTR